jgi:hypothetical protein
MERRRPVLGGGFEKWNDDEPSKDDDDLFSVAGSKKGTTASRSRWRVRKMERRRAVEG